jgi:hypothetical protein
MIEKSPSVVANRKERLVTQILGLWQRSQVDHVLSTVFVECLDKMASLPAVYGYLVETSVPFLLQTLHMKMDDEQMALKAADALEILASYVE